MDEKEKGNETEAIINTGDAEINKGIKEWYGCWVMFLRLHCFVYQQSFSVKFIGKRGLGAILLYIGLCWC